MDIKRRQPIGIELVKRNILTEEQVQAALDYQKKNPSEKLGDIIYNLKLCDPERLIEAMGDILGEKTILLTEDDIKIKMDDYMSIDMLKKNRAVIFDVDTGRVKVCFSSSSNKKTVDSIRMLLLNKGLVMDKYITFKACIDNVLNSQGNNVTEELNTSSDTTEIIDSIIRNGMERRASDIHIEPLEDKIRIRYRIDGQLFEIADIAKDKQRQVTGRMKAISNMHQEKQESQDRKNITISRI